MRRLIDKMEEKEIIFKYNSGISLCELSKTYKMSRTKIRKILTDNNIYIRDIKEVNSKKISEDIAEMIINDYVVNNFSVYALVKKYSLSQKVVETLLKHNGVKKRNYTEAKQLGRKYNINDNYFKTQSPNMAYILGFIAADGNVSKKENQISIQLHEKDAEILQKIIKETESSRPLKFYQNSLGRPTCKMSVWSKEWKDDLKKYNIIPNKTFILKPPYFLDKKYYIDFIRGYFDGDGSIYLHKNISYNLGITGASKEMIEWIRDVLVNEYGLLIPNIRLEHLENDSIMYRFEVYSKSILEKIYNLFYHSNDLLYLNRKKEIFDTFYKKLHETSLPQ